MLDEEWKTDSSCRFSLNTSPVYINGYYLNEELGKGSYSNVFDTFDKNNERFVTKIIKNSEQYKKCGIKEVKFLKKLKDSLNICYLYDSFIISDHIFIVLEKYDSNLYEHYKTGCDLDVEYIVHSCLTALTFLERERIVHADLKPENILLKVDNDNEILDICVSDFSSSSYEHKVKKCNNVVSLWYRAPEIYLTGMYTCKLDIWSLGCIIYELITRKPLFRVKNDNSVLKSNYSLALKHYKVLGCPSHELIKFIGPPENLESKILISPKFNNYIRKYLQWEPSDRLSADQILEIKYLK
uniref:Protein kinase domain protein n=1 Tax=Megaviridae environmental sample TaxID=1737588 RepID=A0A5J6VJI7_9VIRU|nr:MAG: protein kinase domain protein [Megaviridae environmental sample]